MSRAIKSQIPAVLFLTAGLINISTPMFGHHGTGVAYDSEKPTEVKGRVVGRGGLMRSTERPISRRHFFLGLAGSSVTAGVTHEVLSAQNTGDSNPRRIDLHHHFGSPRWIKRVAEVKRQGWERFRDYTPQHAIETMDQGGTQTALISCTELGVWFGNDFSKERQEAISLARDMNEYGADGN